MNKERERLTVKDLRDYLNSLESKFDNSSVAVIKPNEDTILDMEIVCKDSMNIVLSPTKDTERQSMLVLCTRKDTEEIEEIYKKHRNGE